MNRFLACIVLSSLALGTGACVSKMSLAPDEQRKIEAFRHDWSECLVENVARLDDGTSAPDVIGNIIVRRCGAKMQAEYNANERAGASSPFAYQWRVSMKRAAGRQGRLDAAEAVLVHRQRRRDDANVAGDEAARPDHEQALSETLHVR